MARGGSTVGEVPRFDSLVRLFYDMLVRNGEGFPHLQEAGPEALRVADDSVIVEVTGKPASERRRQFPERTAAVVAHPLFQAGERRLSFRFHGAAILAFFIPATQSAA